MTSQVSCNFVNCKTTVTAQNTVNLSDKNLKKEISDIKIDTVETLDQLKPQQYKFKKDPCQKIHYGFVAQDILEIEGLKDLVQHDRNTYSLNYIGLIAVIVETQKKFKTEIEELKKEINILKDLK